MSLTCLRTFFKEKDLDERVYTVSAKGGTTNIFCTQEVVDALLNASDSVQTKAADILRLVDATNADPHGFLEHCATGLAIELEDL